MAGGALISVNEHTQVRVNAVFSAAGSPDVPMDPTTTKLIVRPPGAPTPTTYIYGVPGSPIIRSVAGTYHAYLILDSPGHWWITWTGEGSHGPIAVGEVMLQAKNAVNV